MRMKAAGLALLVGAGAAATLGVTSLAGASGPKPAAANSSTPRWVLHADRYAGGISNGVRAALDAANATPARPTAKPRSAAPVATTGNIHMVHNSYPPMPQNETSV